MKYYFIGIFLQLFIQICYGGTLSEKVLCNINEYQINLKQCKPCHEQCSQCIGPESTDCLYCKNVIYNGGCVDSCPQNYYQDNNNICRKCHIMHCEQCEDIKRCLKCSDQFKLSTNQEYCIFKQENFYAYIDETDQNTIKAVRSCPDTFATNEKGRYCQSIPFCLQENSIIELEEKCFDRGIKDSQGIRMVALRQNVIFYNEYQANVFSFKDYQYIDSIEINSEILRILFYKNHLFVVYQKYIDIINPDTFQILMRTKFNEYVLNTKKSFIFQFAHKDQLFLTTSNNNDMCKFNIHLISIQNSIFQYQYYNFYSIGIIFDISKAETLIEQHVGEQILELKFEDKQNILIVVTFTKINIIYLVANGDKLNQQSQIVLRPSWGYDIQNVFTLIYYPQSERSMTYALFCDEQNLIIVNLNKQMNKNHILNENYKSAYIIQQKGYIALFKIDQINIYKLEGLEIIDINKRIYLKGQSFLLIYAPPYIYISSQETSLSQLYVLSVSFQILKRIPVTQGKITSMYLMRPNDTNNINIDTIIVCKNDNVFDIQELEIQRKLLDNCYDKQEKLFDQSVTFINGFVKSKFNNVDFYVSINIYNRLVFILLKDNTIFKYKEIFDSRLDNISSDEKLTLYLNEIDRKIKIFGIYENSVDNNFVQLVVTFSYYQLQVLSIKRYSNINHQNEKLVIASLFDEKDKKIYIKNTFAENDVNNILEYKNQNEIFKTIYNDMYQAVILINVDKSKHIRTYQVISIHFDKYKIYENETQLESVFDLGFLSSEQIIVFTYQYYIVYNLIDCSIIKKIQHPFKETLINIQILISQRIMIIFSQQKSTTNQDYYDNSYHIIKLDKFQTMQILKPYKQYYPDLKEEFQDQKTELTFLNSDFTNKFQKNIIIVTSTNLKKQQDADNFCKVYIQEYILNFFRTKYELQVSYTTLQNCQSLNKTQSYYNKFYRNTFLYHQKMFGKYIEYLEMGCTFLCMIRDEFSKYNDRIIFQEKILPNFPKILSDNTIFYPFRTQIVSYEVFPKFRMLMIESFKKELTTSKMTLTIQLMKYPSKEILFNYEIEKQCMQMSSIVAESYNTLLICDDNIISVYDLNNLGEPKPKSQNITDICNLRKQNYVIRNNIEYNIECLFIPSYFDPHIFVNGRGIYNYQTNEFILYEYLIFHMKPASDKSIQTHSTLVKEIMMHELPYIILVIVFQTVYIFDKTNNYEPSDNSLKLNSKNYFFEEKYFISLNEYKNIQTLHIFNYMFQSIAFFEESPNEEFKSPYYFNCNNYPRLFILYEMKLNGYIFPFSNTDAPFFSYNVNLRDKKFSVQLCTDEHLFLLVELQKSNTTYYEIQVILYKDSSMFQQYTISRESINITPPQYTQKMNQYFFEKGFAFIQNIIISLNERESNLLYVLPTLNFYYDKINDYGIIISTYQNQYVQFIDFSLIFPFSMNSFSFANNILIQPYQFGYYLSQQQFVAVWTIFYNSQQNAIYFYEFETQLQTKLKLSRQYSGGQRYLYKIEKLKIPVNIDPQKDPKYPNYDLFKKIIFGCFFNDFVVIFTKEKILQYLPLQDFESSILESRITMIEQERKLMYSQLIMDPLTKQYVLSKSPLQLPTQITLGKIAHLCYFTILGAPNLSLIDTNNNIILEIDVYAKLPYDYQKIEIFKSLQYGNNLFMIAVSTKQNIIIYSNKLDILMEIDTQSDTIQDLILEERNKYLFIITFEQLLVYKYSYYENNIQITFTKLMYFYLLSRNQNKLSLLDQDYIAIISKSQITIYFMTFETVQQMYNIRNKNFNQIQNAALFENQFLFVWDVHGMYLYDIDSSNYQVTEIFYREYTHIKILYSGKYIENGRLFIRLIGVTATNVYDIKQEVLNYNNPLRYSNQTRIQKTIYDDISKQCIQISNLNQKLSDQLLQIDKLVQKSHLKVHRIIFLVQYNNQTLIIPEKSFQKDFPQDLSVVYQLNNQTIKIIKNSYSFSPTKKQLLQNLKFKNGSIDIDDDYKKIRITGYFNNYLRVLDFNYIDQVVFESINFYSNLEFRNCNRIYFLRAIFNKEVYSLGAISDNHENTFFLISNTKILTDQLSQNFMKLKNFKNVYLTNITISQNDLDIVFQSESELIEEPDEEVRPFSRDTNSTYYTQIFDKQELNNGFFYFQDCENIQIYTLNLKNMVTFKSLITILYASEIKIYNLVFENINKNIIQSYKKSLFDKRFAILDVVLALKNVEIKDIIVKNCNHDQVIIVNNTYYDSEKKVTINSKYLQVSFNNISVSNIQPKSIFQNDEVYYNIIQVQATVVKIKRFYVTNAYSLTSCFYCQQIKNMSIEDSKFTNISSLQNIISISKSQQLNITNVQIRNVTDITYGLVLQDGEINIYKLLFSNPIKDSQFYIKQSAIKVHFQSELSILQIISSKFSGISNNVGNGTAINIMNAKQVSFYYTVFQYNFCIKNGGAIYAVNSKIYMYNSTIKYNVAIMSGGGFYLFLSDLILDKKFDDHHIKKSVISDNIAQIGGGIRYFLDKQPHILKYKEVFINNQARFFGQDFAMYPTTIKFVEDQYQKFDQVISSISTNKQKIKFYWLDEQGQKLKYFNEQDSIIKSLLNETIIETQIKDLVQELKQYFIVELQSDHIVFNYIDSSLQLTGIAKISEDQSHYIEIESSFLLFPNFSSKFRLFAPLKQIPSYLQKNITNHTDYKNVKFRPCIEGEIIFELKGDTNIYHECMKCQNNTYSLEIPKLVDTKCLICPDNALKCEGNVIIANQGFWREPNTQNIEECFNQPLKCHRSEPELMECSEGGIGPRCESCDYSNKVFKEYYYVKSGEFNCSRFLKSETITKQIIITLVILLIFGLYQGFSVIKINKQMQNQLRMYYLKYSGLANFQVTIYKSGFSSLLKFFVSYFQLLKIIFSYRFNIPSQILNTVNFVGNPLVITIYSLDFVFIKLGLHKKLEMVYIRLIWVFINSSLYFLMSVLLSSLYTCAVKRKLPRKKLTNQIFKIISTSRVYIYYSIYLNLVEITVDIISCEKIGSQLYILADSQFECHSYYHHLFALKISLPILFIIVIVIPFFIWYKLYKNRDNLYKVSHYLKFGFFYQEYKSTKYYWEIIRITYRAIVYIVSTYFSDQLIKSVILSFITIIYLTLTRINQPYRTKIQNRLDFMVTYTMLICFQLGTVNISSKEKYLQGISLLLVCLSNIIIITYFILSILNEHIKINKRQFLYPFITCMIKCMPSLFGRIFKEQKSFLIFHNGWKKVQNLVNSNKIHILRLKLNMSSLPLKKIDFASQSKDQMFNILSGQNTTKNIELKIFNSFTNNEGNALLTLNTKQNINTPVKHFQFFQESFYEINRKDSATPQKQLVNESIENHYIFSSRSNVASPVNFQFWKGDIIDEANKQ